MTKYLIQIKKNCHDTFDDCPLTYAKSIIVKTEKETENVIIQINKKILHGYMRKDK